MKQVWVGAGASVLGVTCEADDTVFLPPCEVTSTQGRPRNWVISALVIALLGIQLFQIDDWQGMGITASA